ncbi:tripartite tricarboxylate transporter substrate binding protein [Cupriavidus sp. AU9028]|uniref:tripartite tricarboxylate transporter substrate binding protein n=1 Tax=Cupriavidus sp. AU9028 TaxID=2871157 RepID=UPI001C97A6E3|nr:tripartite tricarboxylate transporter substrate binding protein [Cupriavidus sp. AU9028]MBY4897082.1 tripartite tricarboxylate transporter substrate binding protein [Cupriavidus sp. AU9028]
MLTTLNRIAATAALALLGAAAPLHHAHAQAPAPLELKITAPAAPGGGWDGASRSLQQAMVASGAAKSVQVNNIPGAGGTVGLAQFVNNAKGDGSQLMTMGITMLGAVVTNKAPVSLDTVTPIARLTADALVVVVPANSPHKTIQDLAAALKADAGKVVWAGGSAGGADHMLAALVVKAAGGNTARLNYVPFSGGGEALAEMLGGRVTAGVSGYNEFESQIKTGKLRALAISSSQRMPGIAVPTLKEQGLDVELLNWRGIVAPPNVSPQQAAALAGAVEKAVKSAEWQKILKARGWDDAYLPAEKFGAYLKSEQARVRDILGSIGLAK